MVLASPPDAVVAQTARRALLVLSKYRPEDVAWEADGEPSMDEMEVRNDGWDQFNHPRYRRLIILKELAARQSGGGSYVVTSFDRVDNAGQNGSGNSKSHGSSNSSDGDEDCTNAADSNGGSNENRLDAYLKVHSPGLVGFLNAAWKEWEGLGERGRDPNSSLEHRRHRVDHDGGSAAAAADASSCHSLSSAALIPGNVPLPREAFQRPSRNVMGKMGYYCTDDCTPIFGGLLDELVSDMDIIQRAVVEAAAAAPPVVAGAVAADASKKDDDDVGPAPPPAPPPPPVVYALCTHPGHHAAYDSFGGYCYVNHAALAARLLQERLIPMGHREESRNGRRTLPPPKVAILDVDYHAGNGSASIFYEDPTVLVVSIHCHPDYDYPFHSGYADEVGTGDGVDGTVNLPLLPGATWASPYEETLVRALETVRAFGARGLVVSLGLDTHRGDPCAIRRAGFELEGDDYIGMGKAIGRAVAAMETDGGGTERSSSVDDGTTDAMAESAAPPSSSQRHIPLIVVQEGGYKMDKVPSAAADVLMGIASTA